MLAQVYNGEKQGTFIYGDMQNGDTSIFYVSPVSFGQVQESLNQKHNFTPVKPTEIRDSIFELRD